MDVFWAVAIGLTCGEGSGGLWLRGQTPQGPCLSWVSAGGGAVFCSALLLVVGQCPHRQGQDPGSQSLLPWGTTAACLGACASWSQGRAGEQAHQIWKNLAAVLMWNFPHSRVAQ